MISMDAVSSTMMKRCGVTPRGRISRVIWCESVGTGSERGSRRLAVEKSWRGAAVKGENVCQRK